MNDEQKDQLSTAVDANASNPAEAEAKAEAVAAEEKNSAASHAPDDKKAVEVQSPAASPSAAGGDPGDESDHEEKELKDVAGTHFGIRGDHGSLDTFASKPVKQEEKK